jgi:hypothetical protein
MTTLSTEDVAAAINRDWAPQSAVDRKDRRTARYIYWRRCAIANCPRHSGQGSDGWILIGPDQFSDAPGFQRFKEIKHMEPMPEYGYMPWSVAGASNPSLRFKQLLETPGGISEFPATQLISYEWDKIAEVRSVRPDIPVVNRIPCEFGCNNRDFITQEDYNQHIAARHEEATAAKALGGAIQGAVAPQPVDPQTLAAAIAAALQVILPQLTPDSLDAQLDEAAKKA